MKIIVNHGSVFEFEIHSWKALAIHLMKRLNFTYKVIK